MSDETKPGAPGIPTVDKAGIAKLVERAEAELRKNSSPSTEKKSANGPIRTGDLQMLTSGQTPSLIGLREPKCPDCGETIPTTLKEISSWLSVWDPEAHRCEARRVREEGELAE